MKKIIQGDTVTYKTTLRDINEDPITTAVVNLQVIDSVGSTVLNEVISHVEGGTYLESKSTSGYALGSPKQIWTAKDSSGTISNTINNSFKVIALGSTYNTYVFVGELESYFPAITDYLDNKSEDHVIAAYKYENRLIDSLGYSTPIGKNSDGFYDQSLRDYNAYNAIYRIIDANQANQVPVDENGNVWYDRFMESAGSVYTAWSKKKITFKNQTSPGDAGIMPATRTQGSSVGTLINNSDSSYGSGFRGSDFTREWSATVIGTGTSGELRECQFSWSKDGGLSSAGTATTSDSWIHLDDQVYVRFTRGQETGTSDIMSIGDKWSWKTNPVRDQVGGMKVAVGY